MTRIRLKYLVEDVDFVGRGRNPHRYKSEVAQSYCVIVSSEPVNGHFQGGPGDCRGPDIRCVKR
jgi:hypothetical protein